MGHMALIDAAQFVRVQEVVGDDTLLLVGQVLELLSVADVTERPDPRYTRAQVSSVTT